jgi:hypothetical protein
VDPPGGVAQAAPQLAVDAGHRVDDERVGPAAVIAVHGGDQPDPGRLDQVLAGDAAAAAEAGGQAVGQPKVGEDDPFAGRRVPRGLVVEEPLLDLRDGVLVARTDVQGVGGGRSHASSLAAGDGGSNPSDA